MNPILFSIREPVKIVVMVLVILLFGIIGLYRLPYQLSPTLSVPQITVTTTWSGATPYEIEREIIEEQEKVFKGIPNLTEMESSSYNGRGNITLKFKLGADVDDALLRVSNKLNEVKAYPENADRPVINATGASTSPVVWLFMVTAEDNPRSAYEYLSFLENEIQQYLERIDGVAELFIGGGVKREVHIIVNADILAAHSLTITDLINILKSENITVSAGALGMGRWDYRIRTVGEFPNIKELERMVIRSTGQKRLFLSDVARVQEGYEKRTAAVINNGREGIGIGIKPEPTANILELTDQVEEVVRWLNETKLKEEKLLFQWAYDERPYILGAITLVRTNILIGGFLAVLVLLLFLRSFRSTVIVATAIPISVIGAFIFLSAFDRTLNVVSLAGISFAVGMLLDSAIVVLENIDRHRKLGVKTPLEYTYDGAKEVWGAILASSLTTVAVFLPVVFMEEEAGQLFRDIAIAVTCAILLSLFVSVSVIPSFANRLFRLGKSGIRKERKNNNSGIGGMLTGGIMKLVALATKNWLTSGITVVALTGAALVATYVLTPKMEYLPQGNRNFVLNIFVPPPGLSLEERTDIGNYLFSSVRPYMNEDRDGLPGIKQFFYIGHDSIMLLGAMSIHEDRAGELIPLFSRLITGIPGMFGVSFQAGLFQNRLGGGRTIDVDVTGGNLTDIVRTAGALFGMIMKEIPGTQVRPVPSLELLFPEVAIVPDRESLKAAGMSAGELGVAIDVLMDGRKIGEFKREGQKKVDLILKGADVDSATPEALLADLIATPTGRVVPLSSLASPQQTTGLTEIRHLERERTITLQVTPPKETSLEEAMDAIGDRLVPRLKEQDLLKGTSIRLSGEAEKLTQARRSLQWNFLLAAVIIYLLMAALFNNFIYPFIILFTLPMAGAGGLIGLKLVNIFTPQPLDIVTMLGFVILIGVVVNNAILIVHQSLNNIRQYGMDGRSAVLESTRTRLRPIYMTTFTSLFGMLPLVISPGPGSEIYRGLGSVILGGLMLSTIFVIFIIPSLLLFFVNLEKRPDQSESVRLQIPHGTDFYK
ncbi:MAG: efflux RND transporter permease subunit [Deltaproteobacteria bacterium]|nr:efflux RND transporter permease subunit [Deltaproteobacteria bacterium]